MKSNYKGCEIEVNRMRAVAGYDYDQIFYNIFTDSGTEIDCGHIDSAETVREVMKQMKERVDDMIENPEEYFSGDRICPDCENETLVEYYNKWKCENPFCGGEVY